MADLRSDFIFCKGTRKSHDLSGGWLGTGSEFGGARMESVSSTSGDDAQHGSIRDVQVPESRDSGEIISKGLFAAREDLDTYEEVTTSLR